jgi:hypothetical protein
VPPGPCGLIGAIRSGGEGFFDRARLTGHELAPLSSRRPLNYLHRRFRFSTAGCGTGCWPTPGEPAGTLELSAALATSVAANGSSDIQGELPSPAVTRGAPMAALGGPAVWRSREGEPDRHTDALAPAEAMARLRVDAAGLQVCSVTDPLGCFWAGARGGHRHARRNLAAALSDDPDRHAWHLANAVVRPDERVAAISRRSRSPTATAGETRPLRPRP